MTSQKYNFINVIHPSGILSEEVLEFGIYIGPGVIINKDVKIGNFALLNTASIN